MTQLFEIELFEYTFADFFDGAGGTDRLVQSATYEAAVVPTGDPPVSGIGVYLRQIGTDCVRVYSIGPGYALEDAIAFAQTFVASLTG